MTDFNDMHSEQGPEAVRDTINNAAAPEGKRRLQPYTWEEVQNLPDREYLIKKVLDRNGLSVMYGKSNSGKTFGAIDMALHIALGWEWHGHKTLKGKVLYIAAEAGFGIKRRIQAFMAHYELTSLPNFYLLPKSVDFGIKSKDINEIIDEIEKIGEVELVVIDTLSRALAGGDENSPVDMGAFVLNCDLVRQNTLAAVNIVHHTGKDEARGGRGHSCLLGAIDTELAVTSADGIVTAEITKQRDGEKGSLYSGFLKVIQLGNDNDGDPITSCVLIPSDEPTEKKKPPLRGRAKDAYEILQNLILEKGTDIIPKKGMTKVRGTTIKDFREALKAGDIADGDKRDTIKKAIQRAIRSLKDAGKIKVWKDHVWVTGQGDK